MGKALAVPNTFGTTCNGANFAPSSTTRVRRPGQEAGPSFLRVKRPSLTWRQVMAAHEETERRLDALAQVAELPDEALQLVTDIAADVVVPILRRDGRIPCAAWPQRPGFLWRRCVQNASIAKPAKVASHLTDLTESERADYALLLKNRYRSGEALEMIRRARTVTAAKLAEASRRMEPRP